MVRKGALWLTLCLVLLPGCASLGGDVRRGLEALVRRGPEGPSLTLDQRGSVELMPPNGLRLVSAEDRALSFAWNPVLVGEVAGYAILRADEAAGRYALVGRTDSAFGTVYTDRGEDEERLGDGQTYHYRIHPFDREGRISRNHAYVFATTDPRPAVPTGLRAYSNLPRRVVLVWEPNESRAVTGYSVLRSPTVAGPWERVGYSRGRLTTVYEDPVPGDLRVMYYRIVASNSFGGESDLTDPIRAVTKAEPLPPLGLAAAHRRLGEIALEWQPNVERDLESYVVYRALRGRDGWGQDARVTSVAAAATRWSDPEVGCGQRVRYRLRAIDADGLESDYSLPLEVVGEALGLAIRRDKAGRMSLLWDEHQVRDWPRARIRQVRRALPDRDLGTAPGTGPFELSGLGPGSHRLAVTLTHQQLPGPRRPDDSPDSPTCTLEIQVP